MSRSASGAACRGVAGCHVRSDSVDTAVVAAEPPWPDALRVGEVRTSDAVVVVPGIMGSALYDTEADRWLWGTTAASSRRGMEPSWRNGRVWRRRSGRSDARVVLSSLREAAVPRRNNAPEQITDHPRRERQRELFR